MYRSQAALCGLAAGTDRSTAHLGESVLSIFKKFSASAAVCAMALGLSLGTLPATAADEIIDPDIIMGQGQAQGQDQGQLGSSRIYRVSPAEDQIEVQVTLHKSETVRVGLPFSEALVGNADVADVIPLTDRSLYIVGKQIGVTRLALLDRNKQLLGVVDVEVTYDLDGLRSRMRGNPALDGIIVQSVNGKILLTGEAPDSVALLQALTLAKQISPDEVTNAVKVASPQQVMLEVRFIEANRTATKALGVESSVLGGDVQGFTGVGSFSGNNVDGFVNDLAKGLVSNTVPFGSMIASVVAGNTNIDIFIKALEQRGLARRLAEPNLVALSGDTASFLAGGEVPIPVSGEDGEITVQFKPFGVGLAFTPTVVDEDLINLELETEVSSLDTSVQVVANGISLTGFQTRRARTTVELRDGQSIAIAGLLQENFTDGKTQVPFLGDLPILGTLFRSASFNRNQTELVIIVTPVLVTPVERGERLALPTDRVRLPNEQELFLLGEVEGRGVAPEVASQDFDGPFGYILE